MPARKIPKRYGVKNPKKMTRWEKRRVSRGITRKKQRKEKARKLIARGQRAREALRKAGKKPLPRPLTMSKQGIVGKNLVLLDGKKQVRIPLWHDGLTLQGVYRIGRKIITVRFGGRWPGYNKQVKLYKLEKGHESIIEDAKSQAFFWALPDLGHMYLPKELRGTGLAPKIASRADRHVRNQQQGKNAFSLSEFRSRLFDEIFTKIGYKRLIVGSGIWVYKKSGRVKKTANMEKFHSIEAIDPKTGKKREYVFPIKGKK